LPGPRLAPGRRSWFIGRRSPAGILWPAELRVAVSRFFSGNDQQVTTAIRNGEMSTANSMRCVDQIGETAGHVWRCLHEAGPMSLAKLIKQVDAPRDVTMQAVGWLAREGKVDIEERNRVRIIGLR